MWKKWQNIIGINILLFFCFLQGYGQKVANVKAGATASSAFSMVCANPNFNTYGVRFDWQGTIANTGNQFIAELSSPTGSFDSGVVELGRVSGQGNNPRNDIPISFSFPTNVHGTAYKIRVRSTNPVTEAVMDMSFEAHYLEYLANDLVLNDRQSVELCSGNSKQISIKSESKTTPAAACTLSG